jgi:hypothetical protein
MKPWMITLPFLFAAGLATAADPAPKAAPAAKPEAAAPAPKAEAAAAPKIEAATEQPAPAKPAMAKRHKARHLPKGDLRKCLELKDNKAIIACSEKQRKH